MQVLCNSVLKVAITWLWLIVSLLLVNKMEILRKKPYLMAYVEIVSVGLLPLVFTSICRDDLMLYGIWSKGLANSFLLSGLFIAAYFTIRFLTKGQLINSLLPPSPHLGFPQNIWYVTLGVFAWGPLEVFFFIWLVVNTDRIFPGGNMIVSWGLIVTVVLFVLLHMLITRSLHNALDVGITFLVLGLVCKYTKNSIGPMIAWTLINQQIWFMVKML